MPEKQTSNMPNNRLREMHARLRETEARLRETKGHLRETEGRLRETEGRLRHIHGMVTWHISAPIREIERFFRWGLRRRIKRLFKGEPQQRNAKPTEPGIKTQIINKRTESNTEILDRAGLDQGRQNILLISHDASRTGAPILAWNVAKRLCERYNVVALILGGGELVSAFRDCCSAVIGPLGVVEPDAADATVERLVASCSIAYAIVNSIESRRFIRPLARASIPVVSLVHEFASYFPPGEIDALDWSTQIVFSTDLTANAAKSEFPHLASRTIHVLAQGRCDLPRRAADLGANKMEYLRAMFRPSGSENAFVVLGVGSISIRKGVDLFLACAAAISALHLPRPVRFVWIGDGYDPFNDRSYSPYLAEQIARSELEEKVAIIDAIEDLEPAYAMTDVFFLSSRLDPLPNVTIDAAFHGLPVVCFDKASGIAALIAAEASLRSCVVPYLDVHAAAAVIAQFANDEAMRASVGGAMRRFAEATFDMDRYVNRLDEIGRQAISAMRHNAGGFTPTS